MKLWNFLLCIIVGILVVSCVMELPHAISGEVDFRENIRQARCAREWTPGYCKGIVERDYLTRLADKNHG